MSEQIRAQIAGVKTTLEALMVQVHALALAVEEDEDDGGEEERPACPRCHCTGTAPAGDVHVCSDCGANFRGQEVVSG